METKQVTFVRVAFKKTMILVRVPGLTKDKWCFADQPAYDYAKNNYKENDAVTIEYEVNKDNNWQVKKVSSSGNVSTQQAPAAVQTQQASPVTTPVTTVGNQYSGDAPEIISENITTAVSQSLIALQGHVSPENVEELINKLYDCYCAAAIKNMRNLGGRG